MSSSPQSLLINKASFQEFCTGFMWQGVGSKGSAGMASVRRRQELSPSPREPVSASSKADPPLAKAEPINNGGNTFVITYLKRGKTTVQKQPEGGEGICERNNYADTKFCEEERQ